MSRVSRPPTEYSGHLRRTYLRACPDCPELSRLKTNRVDAEMNPPNEALPTVVKRHGVPVRLLEHDYSLK
jgi:hypothetical protein